MNSTIRCAVSVLIALASQWSLPQLISAPTTTMASGAVTFQRAIDRDRHDQTRMTVIVAAIAINMSLPIRTALVDLDLLRLLSAC
ncbi:hypothetical protein GCM10009764_43250 [Nocardia ninae]|uniref:Secreted protein n=1 Tax=Nocardia ninae NBRC 108245 TaxID=1210091 RepID=A0A511M8P5_9NOCA|nr:hypothetical protein NN4_15210 [Nocardia ninae NBRC 108245]